MHHKNKYTKKKKIFKNYVKRSTSAVQMDAIGSCVRIRGAIGGPRCGTSKNSDLFTKTRKARTKDAAEPDIKNT